MRKITLQAFCYSFVFFFAFSFAWPAYAHGGEPRLEISVERINPGGVMEVRGVEFDYDEPIVLSLMRSEIQIPLMDITADAEGVFTQVIVLPADLPAGEYNFRARSEHHMVFSPTVIVWGAAIEEEESNMIEDQSDVQFGPVPTFAPGPISTPLPQTTKAEMPVEKPDTTPPPVVLLLFVIGLLAFLGWRILRKR